ncbi:MAG TPA: PDZ domain-containing protein [Hyphomicrobiaceae bacterium]|nr:PDZ domain-containing protein [Hyphomicrobiaceae bacterium]
MSSLAGGRPVARLAAIGACLLAPGIASADAPGRLPRPEAPAGTARVSPAADTGVDIVRMPPPPAVRPPAPTPAVQRPPDAGPKPAPPSRTPEAPPAETRGRIAKLPVKIAALPYDAQRGTLGARTDALDRSLAGALGLLDDKGVLVLDAQRGGPAAQAGMRFGDIIVGLDGKAIDGTDDLRRQVASLAPGSSVVLDVWRVETDGGDFLRTLRRLADAGNAEAMLRLGRLYAAGIAVRRDEVEAVRWFQAGSAAGNLSASTSLAAALLEGRGTTKDTQEGIRLLQMATARNNLEAMYRLAVQKAQGKVVAKDINEALRLFNRAADAGFTPAMLDLAHMYNTGEGVAIDPAKAAQWYRKAADLGNSIGMVNLGFMYQQGRGVERNDITAVGLYRKAASEGNSSGIHNLAAVLDGGRGVPRKDPEQAATLIMRALEMGNEFSLQQMTRNPRAWSVEFRRALQRHLHEAGVYNGKVDGELRPEYTEAINTYFKRER